MNQDWFELTDIRKKDFSNSVWVPLRASYTKEKRGEHGYIGYKEDYFGSGSIAVPTSQIEAAKELEWMDIGLCQNHSGYVEEGVYSPAESYNDYRGEVSGIHLVLDQITLDDEPNEWYLNQDIVLALGLRREGNTWVCPKDGYTEVARLTISKDGTPSLLEIKSQYLKDYLCARDMALYMTHYYSRDCVTDDASFLSWEDGGSTYSDELDRWEGLISPIHEGGHPYGEKIAVFHMERTDVDETDDMPDISGIPTDENVKGDSWEKTFDGPKLFRISGELWRKEILLPGKASPRIRGDKVPSTVYFLIDADGTKISGNDLIESGKWLWFKPEVIMALSHRRGGKLSFYTQQTGSVSCSYGHKVHFGVNDLGLVNVYAKDIGLLPDWQQQIWAGNNISPEGGVSSELLASQVRANPANTQPPEAFLAKGIEVVNQLAIQNLSIELFREHEAIPDLLKRTHRFRAIDEAGLYALAKDLARLIADSLDAEAMQSIVPPPKKTKWGSLKSLENLPPVSG